MTELKSLSPQVVSAQLRTGQIALIDIREADEFAREHIKEAHSLPLSSLDDGDLQLLAGKRAVFHCRSGARTEANCARLASHVDGDAFVLQGGLEAWKAAGLPTEQNKSAPLELMRQVQIAAGGLVLVGIVLGAAAHPGFYGLSAFVGAGLMFAGVSGWCGMAKLLAAMPWNRPQAA